MRRAPGSLTVSDPTQAASQTQCCATACSQLRPCPSRFASSDVGSQGSSMRPVLDEGGVRSLAALEKLPPPETEPLKALLSRNAELAMRPAAGGVSSGPPPPPRPCVAPPPATDDDRSAALPE